MPNRSARHTQVSTRSSSFKLAKSGNNLAGLTTRPNMVAIAVAATMLPTGVWAGWNKNVEIFADYNSDRSFGGVQALIPLRQTADNMTFLGLRGQYGERDDWEINLGAGHRWFNASREWIFGGYGYFDTREAASGEHYNQISIGAEALSVDWDLRANYYKAVGDTDNVVGTTGTRFKGFSVFTNGLLEEALDGGDIEVGRLIPKVPWETRVFAGGYYFDGDKNPDSIHGLRARIETRPRKNIILGLSYSNDDVNKDTVYLEVKYSFGYANESGHRTLEERMIQLPVRDVDIVLTPKPFISDDLSDATVISSNALHIQKDHDHRDAEDVLSAPVGSYENPFVSIAECNDAGERGCQTVVDGEAESDYIFVHGVLDAGADGNGRTTAATPYAGQFFLLDNQHLIGQGVGIFGVGGSSEAPEILYNGGDIVTLSEDTDGDGFSNEVAGLILRDGFGGMNEVASLVYGFGGMNAAIAGRNVTGFDIHDNVIEGGRNGIHLTYDVMGTVQDGNGSIRDNEIFGSNTGLNNTFKSSAANGSSGHGIYIDVGGSAGTFNQTLDLSDNYIAYNDGSGVHISTGEITGDFTVNQQLTLSDNTIKYNSAGVENILYARNGGEINQTVALTNNEISENNDSSHTGVNIGATVGNYRYTGSISQVVSLVSADIINQVVTLDGNTITGNSGDGANISARGNNGAEINQTVTLSDNAVDDNTGNGVNISSDVGSYGTQNQNITLTGNAVDGNDGNGINISGNAGRHGRLYDNGINISSDIYSYGTQNQTITLTGNSVNDNDYGGIEVNSSVGYYGTQNQTITVTDNTVSYNGGNGINLNNYAYSNGTQNQDFTLTGNTVDGNDKAGIYINNDVSSYGTQNQTISLTNNTANYNYGDGINISSDAGSYGTQNQTITLTGNTVDGNDGTGININNYVYSNGAQNQDFTLTGKTTNDNEGGGIYISADVSSYGTQNQTIELTNNTVTYNDRGGIKINSGAYGYNTTQNQTITLSGNSVNYNYSDISSYGTKNQTITLANNTDNDADGSGIHISSNVSAYGTQNQTITLTGNTVSDNYGDGIVLENNVYDSGSSSQVIDLDSNTITGNDGDGVVINNQANNQSYNDYYDYRYSNTAGGNLQATQTVTLLNNTINGNDGDGVVINNQANNQSYNDNYYYDYRYSNTEGGNLQATQTVTLLDNVISGNDGDGVVINNQANNQSYNDNYYYDYRYSNTEGGNLQATQTVTLLHDVISGNDGHGIAIDNNLYDYDSGNAQATQSVGLTGVTVTDNGGYGVNIINYGNGGTASQTVNLSDSGNDFSANAGDDYYFNDVDGQVVFEPQP